MSAPRRGIRMSLSDFPSLVTFRDAAFRLISRWMLLVTSAVSFIEKGRLSDTQTSPPHRAFLRSLRGEKLSDDILSVTRREHLPSLCVQLDIFFSQSINHFLEHSPSSGGSGGRPGSGHPSWLPSGSPAPLPPPPPRSKLLCCYSDPSTWACCLQGAQEWEPGVPRQPEVICARPDASVPPAPRPGPSQM